MIDTAIIHEWLVTLAGAESVLHSIYKLYPGSIYTLFHDPEQVKGTIWDESRIKTSILQRIPFARKHHRVFLPLFPMAIEQFDLRDHKLIISSSYAVAKGVLNSSDQLHICYCHSPMRYIWDLTFEYLEAAGLKGGAKASLRLMLHYIRIWDTVSANRVNEFVANSKYIANRIWKCYNRHAKVIYPPVDVERFYLSDKQRITVTISRLVPYKRVDLIIHAFNHLKLPLVIIGDGPAMKSLKKIALPNIEFVGHQTGEEVEKILSKARAFVFLLRGFRNCKCGGSGIRTSGDCFWQGGHWRLLLMENGLFLQAESALHYRCGT